jgi:hypothetical protein
MYIFFLKKKKKKALKSWWVNTIFHLFELVFSFQIPSQHNMFNKLVRLVGSINTTCILNGSCHVTRLFKWVESQLKSLICLTKLVLSKVEL